MHVRSCHISRTVGRSGRYIGGEGEAEGSCGMRAVLLGRLVILEGCLRKLLAIHRELGLNFSASPPRANHRRLDSLNTFSELKRLISRISLN